MAEMDNGRFFLRVSKEMPDRALILVHWVYGVAQSWLVVVDGGGVGLRRSRRRFTSVWRFVHHYADPRQSELDIPLNMKDAMPVPPPRKKAVKVHEKDYRKQGPPLFCLMRIAHLT